MAIQWVADGNETSIPVDPGGIDIGSGAYTIAALVQRHSNDAIASGFDDDSTLVRYLFSLGVLGTLSAIDDFPDTGGFTAVDLTEDTWYVVGVSKAAGSAVNRFHVWQYADDASGSMAHGNGTGSHGDGNPTTVLHLGGTSGDKGNGLTAVVGFWDSALSDSDMDTLVSVSLTDWAALSPGGLLSAENFDGTGPSVVDVVGTMVCSDIVGTGTTISADNPPSFDFALSAGGTDFVKTINDSIGITDSAANALQTTTGTGIIAAVADSFLNSSLLTTYRWIELHIDNPGADGQANPAVNTTRKQVTWGTSSGGQAVSTNDLLWPAPPASETYSFFTAYSAASSGTPGFTGTISGTPATEGVDWQLDAGDLVAILPVATD